MYDNQTGLSGPPRALRFRIDTSARTATLLEQITDPDVTLSTCCGSARKLPTGNWVMNWGAVPLVAEMTPAGEHTFKLRFEGPFSYRANLVQGDRPSAAQLRAGMDAQYPR